MDVVFDLMLRPRFDWVEPLHFVWAADTGILGKDTAEILQPWLDEQVAYGFVAVEPPPRSIKFDNPTKDKEQMVAFLYHFWYLPDQLMAHYPKPDGATPPTGAVF